MIYQLEATLTIDGDEVDLPVRANVVLEPGAGMGGGWGAVLDGTPEAQFGGRWVDFDDLEIDARTRERIEESFADLAFRDGDTRADEGDYR